MEKIGFTRTEIFLSIEFSLLRINKKHFRVSTRLEWLGRLKDFKVYFADNWIAEISPSLFSRFTGLT